MKKYKSVYKEENKIILEESFDHFKVGDEIRTGKFLNKKAIVKGFTKDKNNQPQVVTSKGTVPLYKFRISKLMPEK